MTKENIKKVAVILLGNCIYSAAVAFFILPMGLITGGTAGIAIFVNHYLGIPVDVIVSVFNIAMFAVGIVVLGRKFAMTTLLSTISYPVFLGVMQRIVAVTGCPTSDEMLCTIFGGGLVGIGIALVLQEGASTGGMDIPPLVINKMTGISVAVLLYAFDVMILLLQVTFTQGEKVLYGILLVCLYSFILEKFLVMGKSKVQIKIIRDQYEAINQMILNQFDRGTTLFAVEGGYTRQEMLAVLTVVSRRELFQISEAIKNMDPEAFIVIEQVKEVRGRGFTIRKDYNQRT